MFNIVFGGHLLKFYILFKCLLEFVIDHSRIQSHVQFQLSLIKSNSNQQNYVICYRRSVHGLKL